VWGLRQIPDSCIRSGMSDSALPVGRVLLAALEAIAAQPLGLPSRRRRALSPEERAERQAVKARRKAERNRKRDQRRKARR
jgi:hypothetical protein